MHICTTTEARHTDVCGISIPITRESNSIRGLLCKQCARYYIIGPELHTMHKACLARFE